MLKNKWIKRIAIDLTPVLPGGENGGAKVMVLELIRKLSKLENNFEFIIFTRKSAHKELSLLDRRNVKRVVVLNSSQKTKSLLKKFISPLIKYIPTRVKKLGVKILLNRLNNSFSTNEFFQKEKIDLLFCPFTAPIYHKTGIPTVSIIYDLQHKSFPQFFSDLDIFGRDQVFDEACSKSDALVTISNFSRQEIIKYSKIQPKDVYIVYPQLAKRMRNHVDISILKNLLISPRKYIIYPANFWKHKNHEMLFTALGMAYADGLSKDIKLVCTGFKSEREAYLQEYCKKMGLNNQILFPGYISSNSLSSLLNNALALIFPSLFEGFGIPIVEAMSGGVPVACSNTTCLPEIAGDAALFFDPRIPQDIAKCINSLAQDEKLREKLIIAGYVRAAHFSNVDLMAKQYMDVIKSTLDIKQKIIIKECKEAVNEI